MRKIDTSEIKVSINVESPEEGLYIAELKGKSAYGETAEIAKLAVIDELTYQERCDKKEKEMREYFEAKDITGGIYYPSTLVNEYKREEEEKVLRVVKKEIKNIRVTTDEDYDDCY